MTEVQPPLPDRHQQIISDLQALLENNLAEEHQNEVGELINLLPDVCAVKDEALLASAETAAKALRSDPPNLDVAQRIKKDLKRRVGSFRTPWAAIIHGGSPPSIVILGLGTLLYLAIPILFAAKDMIFGQQIFVGVPNSTIMTVVFFGALGSIVSIMVRLQDFSKNHITDKAILFFTGLFKPIVGTSFALFVFVVINADMLPITVDLGSDKGVFFFAALSFIAGFSERFAQDIVARAEKGLGNNSQPSS